MPVSFSVEGEIYQRFIESLKGYSKRELDSENLAKKELESENGDGATLWLSKHLGPLSAEMFSPSDWYDWCEDEGVVCFGLMGPHLFKIYFGRPSDRSVYHVIDFVYSYYYLDPTEWLWVKFTLVGSKIYLFYGCVAPYKVAVNVFYYDVAVADPNRPWEIPRNDPNPTPYEWKEGPDLNSFMHNPHVFTLDDCIYVLSMGLGRCGSARRSGGTLEVLKHNSNKWEMLDTPASLTEMETAIRVFESYVDEEAKKILVHAVCQGGPILFIYDVKHNSWMEVKESPGKYNDNIPSLPGKKKSLVLDACERDILCLDESTCRYPFDDLYYWSLIYSPTGVRSCHIHADHLPNEDTLQRNENQEFKSDFAHGLLLIPLQHDSKVGSFKKLLFERKIPANDNPTKRKREWEDEEELKVRGDRDWDEVWEE